QEQIPEKRRHQRLPLEVEITVRTNSELLPGRTLDISESGLSAILPVALQEGENVQLQIRIPGATATTSAVVRGRNVFRHGFEFIHPLHDIIGTEAVGDCKSCAGTGSILQALAGEQGVAFARSRCAD